MNPSPTEGFPSSLIYLLILYHTTKQLHTTLREVVQNPVKIQPVKSFHDPRNKKILMKFFHITIFLVGPIIILKVSEFLFSRIKTFMVLKITPF